MNLEKSSTQMDSGMNMTAAIYPTHQMAVSAITKLQKTGFDMKKLSIVGTDYHTQENVVGYYNTGDRMKAWGTSGAFWGGIWGLLFGGAFFLIPGVGPILMAGPLIASLVGMLEGAVVVGGLSVLGGALVSIGIPENTALMYQTEIGAGKFLLIVHGTQEEVARAKNLLMIPAFDAVPENTTPAINAIL